MQELPLQASQNNGQTASSFNGVNTAYSSQMVSSTNQSFSGQHHLQKPQQQQGHSNQQYPQPQSQNHNQAYVHVVCQLHQQHHQQYQQQQQQQNRTGFFFAVKEVSLVEQGLWCKTVHFSAGTGIWCYIDIALRFGVCISFAGIGASSGIQPMSAGLTLLQGMNSVQLGSGLVASSVGLNVGATARDVQRFASGRSLSVSIDEQQQWLQHYNRLVAGRSLQPSAVTVSAGFPIIGLPNSNDCAVPTAGNGTGMMCGLGRGMALPSPGFPGLGSAGIPGMVSSGISNMLSSNGLGLPVSGLAPSGTMHVLGSMIRRPRDVQMLQSRAAADAYARASTSGQPE